MRTLRACQMLPLRQPEIGMGRHPLSRHRQRLDIGDAVDPNGPAPQKLADPHRNGAGSGADIATSVHGGLIEFRMDDRQVTEFDWPQGLYYRLIWSGTAIDTRAKLAELENTTVVVSRAALARSATKMASAWTSAATVLGAYPSYIEQLRQFSVDHGLGIFDAGHEQLSREAAAAGLVYKPCGAGGGDIGILLGASDARLEDFLSSRVGGLSAKLDPVGVILERH